MAKSVTHSLLHRCWKPRQSSLWLCAALAIFLQIAVATHHHDEVTLHSHDCTVCTQLHSIDHSVVVQHSVPKLPETALTPVEPGSPAFTSRRLSLPPVRGPPTAV